MQTAELNKYCREVQEGIRETFAKDPTLGAALVDPKNYIVRDARRPAYGRDQLPVTYLDFVNPATCEHVTVAACDTRAEANIVLSARLGALIEA